MTYERQIATARRLIEKAGMSCQWRKAVSDDVQSETPWRDGDDPLPDPVDVPIAFFTPSDVGKGSGAFAAFLSNTEVPQGSEVGLMPGDVPFAPDVADMLYRDGVPLQITKIDRLAPSNVPILYYVWIE